MSDVARMNYETELDGIRALAVMGVLLFHLGVSFMSGGFTGVDTFFVLSGYLITAIISRDMLGNRFSFMNFYLRRARRLLPSLFVVIMVCYVISFVLLSPDHLKSFARSSFHAVLSVSNFNFWLESGYFDSSKYTKPLLHTWSLGVEEQFYFIWPLMLAALAFVKKLTLKIIFMTVFVILGFLASLYAMQHIPSAVFYLSPFRAWQFAAGGLLALVLHGNGGEGRSFELPHALAALVTLSGLVMTVYGFVAIQSNNFPGFVALIPTFGALLMVLGGMNPLSKLILSNPVSRFFGRLSYSLYLTHWPIIVFWRYYTNSPLSPVEMVLVSALSIGTAFLLYRFVETRLRKPWGRGDVATEKFAVPAGIATAMCALMLISVYPWVQNGWNWRLSKDSQALIVEAAKGERVKCDMRAIKGVGKSCHFGTKKRTADYVLIGDSHSAALAKGLNAYAQETNRMGIRLSKPGTLPLLKGRTFDSGKLSERFFDDEFKWLARSKVETVIIHGRFSMSWETTNPKNQKQNVTKYVGLKNEPYPTTKKQSQAYFKKALGNTLRQLSKSKKTVVLVGAIPFQGVNLAQCINRPEWLISAEALIQSCQGFSKDDALERMSGVNQVLKEAAEKAGVIWVDPTPIFCPQEAQNCHRVVDGKLLYKDDDHLTAFGASFLTREIYKELGWGLPENDIFDVAED